MWELPYSPRCSWGWCKFSWQSSLKHRSALVHLWKRVERKNTKNTRTRVVDATSTGRQDISPKVRQSPRRSSYVPVVEVTTKVRPLRSPPQVTTKVNSRFLLRIKGWYKYFGMPSQMNQHGQPWRTPSRLGFQEPKSNKCKPTGKTKKSSVKSRIKAPNSLTHFSNSNLSRIEA